MQNTDQEHVDEMAVRSLFIFNLMVSLFTLCFLVPLLSIDLCVRTMLFM